MTDAMTAPSVIEAGVLEVERNPSASLPTETIVERIYRAMQAADPELAAMREALGTAEESLDQLLDDMGEDGLCVCQAAKDEAIEALAVARAALARSAREE